MRNIKLLGVVTAVGCLIGAGAANAQRHQGWYVGGGLGATFANDSDVEGAGVNTSSELNVGAMGALSAGFGFPNGLRAEVEGAYRKNDVDSTSGVTSGTGDIGVLSGLVNLLYDFDTGTPWTPYLGGGIGFGRLKVENLTLPAGFGSADDDAHALAYQGIVGVGYRLAENLQLFADYRYFATDDGNINRTGGTAGTVDVDYSVHTVMAGLRLLFPAPKPAPIAAPAAAPAPVAQPAPPPAPAAAARPAIARSYLVFFDWDKATLTPEAVAIIRTAAANAKAGSVTRLELTGHADRSGADRYNLGLSQRRADSVKAELLRQGIKDNEIATFAKGEREPLVPTADGVREPQNRRVEIVFK